MNRNYLVTKSNYLIVSKHNLSAEEQKIILTLASIVEPNDEELKEYTFKIGDFIKLIGVKNENKYTEIPKITKQLMSKVLEIKKNKTTEQFHWLAYARHEEGSGHVTLKFMPELKPYFLNLKNFYTSYRLHNVLNLNSKYSIRIYEILKSNAYKNESALDLDIEYIRETFYIKNEYKRYSDFKRKVILTAQKEINEKTDIKFTFDEIKKGRKIETIRFFIQSVGENKITPATEKKDITTDSINIDEDELKTIQEITENKIDINSIKSIYINAAGDIEKIKQAYKASKDSHAPINNLTGYMIKLVKLDKISDPIVVKPQREKRPNSNFEQRVYTKADFIDIENALLYIKDNDVCKNCEVEDCNNNCPLDNTNAQDK